MSKKKESIIDLGTVFQKLKDSLEKRKFHIEKYSSGSEIMIMAYNESYRKQDERVIVDYKETRVSVTVTIEGNKLLKAKKLNAILKNKDLADFFSVNSKGGLERIIPADMGAYPDIDDIANKTTRAYGFIVTT